MRSRPAQVPYVVIQDGSGNVKIKCPNAGKDFAAEEISAQARGVAAAAACRLPSVVLPLA